jgi:xanthine/CO dehydrogenase XdhC/CoxF family maturation factor
MSELRALVAAARQLRNAQQPFLSASVLAVRGSGYRHTGARMITSEAEWLAGSISGGCLERDVVTKGFWHTRAERARLMTYDQTSDALGESVTSGCQGIIDVLLERHEPGQIDEADVFTAAERCLRDEQDALIITVIRSARADLPLGARLIFQGGCYYVAPTHEALLPLFADAAREALEAQLPAHTLERAQLEVLVERMLPPIHLFVFGSGHDTAPLVGLARQLGWTVSVWDASPRSSARQKFQHADHYLTGTMAEAVARSARAARGAAVVMGHHFPQDRAAVEALLASSVPYIGILGSRQRIEQLLDGTGAHEQCMRVYAPVGLKLGAQTPAEIALAIVAQVQSVLAQPTSPLLRR